MRESKIIKDVLAWVKRARRAGVPIKAVKHHGNQYTEAGTPDLDIVAFGKPFKLEAKVPGEKPTKLQIRRLEEWRIAGAVAEVIYSVDDARLILEQHLERELPK